MNKKLFCLLFLFVSYLLPAQQISQGVFTGPMVNAPANGKGSLQTVFNGNNAIATSYTATACGLNYIHIGAPLAQRSGFFQSVASTQPVTFNINSIPTCGKIIQAFLYAAGEGDTPPPAVTANIINPASVSTNFPMTMIGTGSSRGWGFDDSHAWRANVTSIITGNGNYVISGLPVGGATPASDIDMSGVSLFVIYSDESQNYTGSIVLADGMNAIGPYQSTITGFNVCATPTSYQNFLLLEELQGIGSADISLNVSPPAFSTTQGVGGQTPWMFFAQPGTAPVNGQTSAVYAATPSGGDALGIVFAGMYYRTNCLSCPAPMTVTAVASTCLPTGGATVSVTGNMPNSTISWLGTAQTGSVATGLAAGIRSVTVSDPFNCKAPVTRTVNIISQMTLSATGSSCAPNNSATAVASGGLGGYTYTWTSTAQNGSLVTWMPTGTHTVTVSDAGACQTRTASVNVAASSSIATTNTVLCIGYSTTMTANAAVVSYSWSPAGNIQSPTNSPTVVANPTTTTIYTVTATNSVGCLSSNTLQLFVVNTQTVPVINPTTCVNSTLTLIANTTYTGSTYSWQGPAGYTSIAQNPTRTPATLAMSGPYSITVISAPGCTSNAVANVTVYPIPANPSITTNAPICSGFSLTLNGSGGTSYFWQGPNTFTSNLQNIAIVNATNTLHSGVYTLTALFGTGCSNTFTRNILVRALPVPTITSNSPVCLGKNLVLQGSGGLLFNWTGPNAFASAIQNPTVSNVTAAAGGTYSLQVTDGFACQGSTTHSVTILNNPTITATGTTVCFGYQAVLTSTGMGANQYTWYGPNSFSSTAQNPTVSPVNNLAVGVYTVILGSALNSCTAQITANLNNIPLPVMTTTGTSVCSGQQAVLLSNGANGYNWAGPGGYTAGTQNATVNNVTNTAVQNYTVVGTAVNGCTASAIATLQARPNPTASAIGTVVCYAAPATLTASGGVTYSWTGPNAYTSIQQNAAIASVTNIAVDIYTVMVTAANSCTDVTTATLTSKPNPTVTTTGTTVCLMEPAPLQASSTTPGVAFYWTGPGTYTSSLQNPTITMAQSAQPQTYTVVGTAPNSCTHVTTVVLNTFPLPTVTATGTLICLNEPFTILGGGANTYTWTGPSIVGTSTSQNIFIPNVDAQSIGNYTVVGTGPNSCTNLATANISTLALPNITATGTTVCFGQPATLKGFGGIMNGYTWTGPGTYTSNQVNAFIPAALNVQPQVYTVVGTGVNGCTNTAFATLSTYTLPIPVISGPPRVCLYQSLLMSGSGASTYTWTGPYSFISSAQSLTLPIYNPLQEGTYTLSVHDNLGCFSFTTAVIKVDPSPEGVLVADNPNMCLPYCSSFSLRLSGDAPAVTDFAWEVNNTSNFTTPTFSYCVGQSTNKVIGSFTNALGCSSKLSLGSGMVGFPVPKADYDFLPVNPVESVDQVNFTNLSTGEKQNKWNWYFSNSKGYIANAQNTSYIFENAGTYAVAMVVSNNYGCSDTIVKTVIVDADYKLYVPNAFTPDGDGLNDVFMPKGRGIDKYHLTVYDRWGIIVFQSDDFSKGWDGTEKGKALTDEVYTWRINATDVNGKIKELAGYVTLIR